jgi:hypothetical protein
MKLYNTDYAVQMFQKPSTGKGLSDFNSIEMKSLYTGNRHIIKFIQIIDEMLIMTAALHL